MTHSNEVTEKIAYQNLPVSNQNNVILVPGDLESQAQARDVYSVFSKSQKRCVVF